MSSRHDRRGGPGSPPARVTKLTQSGFLKWLVPAAPDGLELLPLARAAAADDEFTPIGRDVAAAKAQLDAIAPADFNKLMQALDLYSGLKRTMRAEYGMLITTNASLKMYEMLGQLRLLPSHRDCGPSARVFCNAELPGAFIVAINHFIRTTCPETNLDWVASSYLPEAAVAIDADSTILGDQYGLYAGNRGQWLMGPPPNALPAGEPPVSGDVTSADVVAAIAEAVHARFTDTEGATLYTSDAGIDISSDYAREEELTALVNYGQVLSGVLALARGGSLVTKQFMFVRKFTRSVIALLTALFDEMYVVKPLTSRPGNSEVYLVGKGFRGIGQALADALLDRLAAYREAPDTTPCDWTPLLADADMAAADAALLRVARQVHGRQQVAFLNEAAALYGQFRGRLDQLARALAGDARRVQEAWLAENPARRIRDSQQLTAAKRGGGSSPRSPSPERIDVRRSDARPRVRILVKRLTSGLKIDAEVLRDALTAARVGEVFIVCTHEQKTDTTSVDIQFHLEHYFEGFAATTNYLVVNQEFLFDWDVAALTSGKAIALCKTEYARCLLRDEFGLDPILIGFTTPEVGRGIAPLWQGPAACRGTKPNDPPHEASTANPQLGDELCNTSADQGLGALYGLVPARRAGTLPSRRPGRQATDVPETKQDPALVAHLAGTSSMKGTLAVLTGWVEGGGLAAAATLFITRQPSDFAPAPPELAYWDALPRELGVAYNTDGGAIPNLERHGNVYLARRVLTASERDVVAGRAAIHLCPSVAEGFGHCINGARAAGAVTVITDAPPMNELVDATCGIVAESSPGRTMAELNPTQGKNYPPAIAALQTHAVAPASLMAATTQALGLTAVARARLGAAARARYLDERAHFFAAVDRIVSKKEV